MAIAVFFLFFIWFLLAIKFTFVTILVTFLVIALGGTFMTSGGGDGRNGRR